MASLVPAIHVFADAERKTWMPATSAGMTTGNSGAYRPFSGPNSGCIANMPNWATQCPTAM